MKDSLSRGTNSYGYPPNTSTEYRRFGSDYFSGADVRIYFRDIWLDEVTNLQFSLQENVAPIFGYASTTWDKVARGTRHIQGSFTINFKESYYLHSVMQRLESSMKEDATGRGYSSNGFSEEAFKEGSTIEHLLSANSDSFYTLADEFESSLWGESESAVINHRRNIRPDNSFFYGDGPLKDVGFNILIAYGPINEVHGSYAPGTVHSLVGVQLTGVSQVVGTDGRPIEEQYQFIAKDLDANVSNAVTPKSAPKPVVESPYKHRGPGGPQEIK